MPDPISTLERELRQAQDAFYALRALPHVSGTYRATHDAVLDAEAALAKARSEPYATRLELGFLTSREAPIALCGGRTTILICEADRWNEEGKREDAGYAIIEFPLCDWSTFGYPNDEAFEGHPMYGKGLDAYGAFEVFNSPWKRRMAEQNRVSFPETKGYPSRHLIFSFHGSTFECLAERMEVTIMKTDYLEAFRTASEIINRTIKLQ